jgi:hypothetical protein
MWDVDFIFIFNLLLSVIDGIRTDTQLTGTGAKTAGLERPRVCIILHGCKPQAYLVLIMNR